MKKTLLFIFAVSFFFGCSVEPMDPYLEESFDQELKMTTDDNDCVSVHSFGDAGTITVTNDGEHLLVSIAASGDFSLTGSRLQVSNSFGDFPTVGRGNLPPGKMDIHKKFKDGIKEYTWQFPLSDYNGSVVIASFTEFSNIESSFTAWAGDEEVKFGNWAYFGYQIIDCPPACETPDLGDNVELTYSYAESQELKVEDLEEALGYNQEGYPQDGDFEPSLENLLVNIIANTGDERQFFSTSYTIGDGNCEDSVNFTLEVHKKCYLGEDRFRTIPYSVALSFPDYHNVKAVFLSLLQEEEVPLSELAEIRIDDLTDVPVYGSFEPGIWDVIYEFQSHESDEEFTLNTTYSTGLDECEDSVELEFLVVPDNQYYQ